MPEQPRDRKESPPGQMARPHRSEGRKAAEAFGQPGEPTSGRLLLQYEGRIQVRPIGRGVVLEDHAQRMQLEDLPDGYYQAQITVWREA